LADARNLAFVSSQEMGDLLDPIAPGLPCSPCAKKLEKFEVSGEARGV
jgi:hypothetical protein